MRRACWPGGRRLYHPGMHRLAFRPLPSARRCSTWLALALLLAATACGPDETPRGRFAVVARGLDFGPADPTAPAPAALSQRWAWTAGAAPRAALGTGWSAGNGTQAVLGEDGLYLLGEKRAELLGPGFDAEVCHTLALTLRVKGADTLVVQWKAGPDEYHPARRWSTPLTGNGDAPTTVLVPVSSLRGARHAVQGKPGEPNWAKGRDAAEGVDELRLLFEGEGPVRVGVEELAFVSDFDREPGSALRLQRLGIYREGVVLRGRRGLQADLRPGPWDRLRFALALAGAEAPQRLLLSEADGRLRPAEWLLQPGADWVEAVIDLAPLEGSACRLQFATDGPGTLMIGSILRLAPAAVDHPPMLLYLEDTLRADRLGTYGYTRPTDPTLAALAAAGVVFDRAFAASNWTRPATSSVLTGLDCITHGNNAHADRVADEVVTLAEALASQGYVTTSFITNYNAGDWAGLAQGMDVFREPTAYGATHTDNSLTSSIIAGPLDDFLREHRDELFFVYVHSVDPHAPYLPPDEDVLALAGVPPTEVADAGQRATSAAYDGEVRHNDRMLGRLDTTLVALGLRDALLFAFVSDHGEAFGEHGTLEHRNTLYQEELHVPLVLHWPAGLPGGQRRDEPVSQIDLPPTMLGLAGLELPASWQGRDLSAALRGGRIEPAPLLLHTEHSAPKDGLSEEVAIVWWPYKLIAGLTPEGELVPRALFDLSADPVEQRDVQAEPAASSVLPRIVAWGEERVRTSRAASHPASADAMDPAQRDWMQAMGYLGR